MKLAAKQAHGRVDMALAARFLYMVVLYMALVLETTDSWATPSGPALSHAAAKSAHAGLAMKKAPGLAKPGPDRCKPVRFYWRTVSVV